jgi:hypothetical protein
MLTGLVHFECGRRLIWASLIEIRHKRDHNKLNSVNDCQRRRAGMAVPQQIQQWIKNTYPSPQLDPVSTLFSALINQLLTHPGMAPCMPHLPPN